MFFGLGGAHSAQPAGHDDRRSARPQRPMWPTLKRAIALHRPHLGLVFALSLIVVVAALAGLGPPLVIREIIDGTFLSDSGNSGSRLNWLVAIMVALVGTTAVATVVQSFLSNTIGQSVMFDLRRELYRHLSGMSLRWFTSNRTGEVLSRVSNDVSAVQAVVSDTFGGVLGNLITVVSTFALMLTLDWRLAVFSIFFVPIFILPVKRVGRIQRNLMAESQEELATMNSQMQETLSVSGALLVKTFGRQENELDRFNSSAKRIRDLNIRRAMVGRWFNMSIMMFGALAPAVVYWYGGHRVIGGEASTGTVVAFAALLTRLFGPITVLLNTHITVLSSLALFERLFDYLDLHQEIGDRPGAQPLANPRGRVTFEKVSFSYIKGIPALEGISFDVPPGKFAALVGPSGAGKTTTAYLVPRLYDVNEGRVLIDGHDIRDITMVSLADCIGMVNQEPYLFHTSIRDNLRYARPDATDEQIEQAARAANIHDFVSALPHGYGTIVGERGYRLSGGEKQRVAIARALLKDPAILILDEATSSVDSATERQIQGALETLTRGRTVIAIAHRLSTILAADVILVLDGGRVVEQGTHQELLALEGRYASLYQQQFYRQEGAAPSLLPGV